MAYDFKIPHQKINRGMRPKCEECQPEAVVPPADVCARDIFLHALFARIAGSDDSVTEFETKFFQEENTIELDIPDSVMDYLETIDQGVNFRRYIDWLMQNKSCVNVFCPSDTDPDNSFVSTGDMYYNTDLQELMIYDADTTTKWLSVAPTNIKVCL